MYRLIRTAHIKIGKFPDAAKWAKEVADYVNAKYPGHSTQVFTEVFGQLGTMQWTVDFADLTDAEKVIAQTSADQEYLTLVRKGQEFQVETGKDTLMRSV